MKARITIDPPDDALLGELAPFLHSVLDAPRFETTAYLKQMYGAAPQTPICVQARIDGEIVAHQAFLWLPMRTALNNTLPATLSVNSSAAARLRDRGVRRPLPQDAHVGLRRRLAGLLRRDQRSVDEGHDTTRRQGGRAAAGARC